MVRPSVYRRHKFRDDITLAAICISALTAESNSKSCRLTEAAVPACFSDLSNCALLIIIKFFSPLITFVGEDDVKNEKEFDVLEF